MIAGQSVRVLTVALVLLTVVTAVGLLFLSPPFAALVGLVLIATAVATVMSRLASRWSVLIAAGSSAIFTLAHVAESARLVNPAAGLLRISSLFDSGLLSRPEVWLPVLLAIPAFSLIVACAQSLSLGLQRHREVLIEAERSLREMAHEDPATGLESRS